jgi:hypothetical protein
MDHDQRFKSLIQEFFADFLQLFFAPWAARFDLTTVEWLDKEVLPDPPEGTRHVLDLVARIRTRESIAIEQPDRSDRWLALIHIEIESSDRITSIKTRLPRYYVYLRDRYQIPVLPIVVYLKVGLDGVGVDTYEETFWELDALRLRYLYVGLPGLDAVKYVQSESRLGVALSALMRIPSDRVAWLGVEALRRLTEAPLSDQQRFLLGDCVQAYLPLKDDQKAEYDRLLATEPYSKVQAMNQTVFEKGMEKALQDAILRLGRKKFGVPASTATTQQIRAINDPAKLEQLMEQILDAVSWDDLLALP